MTELSDFPVEEILARCLTDPSFLTLLSTDRDAALRDYPLDARTRADFDHIDVRRLRRFSGFIGKVQHNYLWEVFPATRRLLKQSGREIDVFADYRAVQLSPSLRTESQSAKIRSFAAYLSNYAVQNPGCAGLATAIRYEHICWELHQSVAVYRSRPSLSAADIATSPWPEFLRLVPAAKGPLRIESFDCDPSRLVSRVLEGTFTGASVGKPDVFVLRLDPDSLLLQTVAIDELTALLLSCIDDKRSVRAVIAAARRRALATTPPQAFRAFFEDAQAADVIELSGESPCA
jgi:hypothetical protein